jgi:hypothetical protein
MIRFTSFALVAPLTLALAQSAHAQSQAEIAAKLNEEGKELMFADKYAEAAKKFQEAVARVPEAKYFVNLCTARLQEGKLDEALTACNAVGLNNPTPDQKTRADKLIEKINEEAKKQNLELHPGGGGGGNTNVPVTNSGPGPTGPGQPPSYTPTVGRPLQQNLVAEGPPDHRYTWTLGADIYGNGGRIGQPDFYASAGPGLRIKGDYMLMPSRRVGAQLYFQYAQLSPGMNDTAGVSSLDIVDFGLAAYKDVCLGTPRLCITPLLGAQLSFMSPQSDQDFATGSDLFSYFGLGARGEVAFSFAFGRRYEHVFSAMVGVNLYSAVLAGPDASSGNFSPEEAGLDVGGALAYVGIGYTYRFNTPIGSRPFIILE